MNVQSRYNWTQVFLPVLGFSSVQGTVGSHRWEVVKSTDRKNGAERWQWSAYTPYYVIDSNREDNVAEEHL